MVERGAAREKERKSFPLFPFFFPSPFSSFSFFLFPSPFSFSSPPPLSLLPFPSLLSSPLSPFFFLFFPLFSSFSSTSKQTRLRTFRYKWCLQIDTLRNKTHFLSGT